MHNVVPANAIIKIKEEKEKKSEWCLRMVLGPEKYLEQFNGQTHISVGLEWAYHLSRVCFINLLIASTDSVGLLRFLL